MSNPVQDYVQRYKPPTAPTNPVDEYLKRYGTGQATPAAPTPQPPAVDMAGPQSWADKFKGDDTDDGLLMTGLKFVRSVMKASAHLPIDVAKGVGDLVYTTALAGGTSPENEASRAASRRFGTGRENYTPPEQQVKPEGEVSAGQQAVDFINIPKMVKHSYEEFQNAKTIDEAGRSAVGVAFGVLGAYGLVRGGYNVARRRGATPPPSEPPPADGSAPTPEPSAPIPTGEEIVAKAEAERAATKAAINESRSVAARRRIAWAKMTPEQRALVTPELPATEHGKAWNELSTESKAIIKDAWAEKPKPVDESHPNLDDGGTPIPNVDPAIAGEIGPDGIAETPLGPPVRKNGHQLIIDEINRLRALDGKPPLEKAPGDPKVLDLAAKLAERAAASKAGETATPKIEIPPVEDQSRGTWDGVERRSTPRPDVLSPEDLLKAMRQRGMLPDKTTSGGSFGQELPPRTPEAEAVMSDQPVSSLDAQIAGMKKGASTKSVFHGTEDVGGALGIIKEGLRSNSSLDVGSGLSDGTIVFELGDVAKRPYPEGELASKGSAYSNEVARDIKKVYLDYDNLITRESATDVYNKLRQALDESGRKDVQIEGIRYDDAKDRLVRGGPVDLESMPTRKEFFGKMPEDKLAKELSDAMSHGDDVATEAILEEMANRGGPESAPTPDAPKAPPPAGDLTAPEITAASPAETTPKGPSKKPKAKVNVDELKTELADLEQRVKSGNLAGSPLLAPITSRIEVLKTAITKAEKKPKVKTPAQELDAAETKNDRAFDKGQITEEQWGAEVARIGNERMRLRQESLNASKVIPAEVSDATAAASMPDQSIARTTVKAKPVEQGLDPKTFPSRMRDNLKTVSAAELEQRLVELEGRKAQVVGDKEATATYQKRINQIHEVQADRANPSKKSLIDNEKGFVRIGPRKVLNDKTPEQMSPAERTIAESVITEPDLTQPLGLGDVMRRKVAELIDSEYGFKQAANRIFGKGSPDAVKATMRAETGSGALTRAEEFIRGEGPMLPTEDGNWVRTGNRSINSVIQSVGGESQVGTLGRVWAALNTVELWGMGKMAGPDFIAAKKFSTEADPKFIAGSRELRAVALDAAKYAEWGGLLESKTTAKFAKQMFYAPIKRLLSHTGEGRTVGTRGGQDLVSPSGQPIKRLKGSRKAQLNPVETLVDNIYRTIRAAEQNRRVADLVKGAIKNPEAAKGILEPAGHTDFMKVQRSLESKAEAAVAAAKEQGVSLTKAEAIDQLKMTGDETLNITDNLLHVWIDGKPSLWRVSDELAYSIKHMQAQEFGLFTRIIGAPAGLVHAGVVADPFFLARQVVLDNMQAFINTQYGFNPFAFDQLRGWLHLIRNTPLAQEYRMAGGGFSGLTSSRFRSARTALADAVRPYAVRMERGPDGVWRAVRNEGPISEAVRQLKEIRPLQAWKTLVAPLEEAARVGEYMRARGAGASMLEAIYAAKRVTTNFQRSGGAMQAAAHTIPFLNAGVQGLAQAAENFSRRPKQWTARAAIAAAVPAFMLWFMNKDDEEIQQLRRSEGGQRYFFYRSPEGTILKMRKPYLEGAIFANGIEAALDAYNEQDPAAIGEWGKAIAREASFNAITTLGYVPLSLWANKDFRTGLPIVPERMADVDPAYQAGPYTGSAARVIGETIGASPAQVEYTVRGTLGGVGALGLKAIDAAIDYNRTGELPKPADIPGMSSFVAKYPSQSVRPMQDFYRESERLARISNTIDYLSQTRPEALAGYLTEHENDLALLKLYAQSREKVGAAQRVINELRGMPPEYITQHEKDDLINSLILNMIQQAKTTNQIARDITGANP